MERGLKMFVIMLLYLGVVGFGKSNGARLLENDIFVISLRNPNLNGGAGLLSSAHQSSLSLPSDEAVKVWGDKMKEQPEAAEIVLNVEARGTVMPSGNAMVKMQQLSTSTPSPGVGHMQIFASVPKSPPRSTSEGRQRKRVSKKRILQSTPSPGGGH